MIKYKEDLEQLSIDIKESHLFTDEIIDKLNKYFDALYDYAKSQGIIEEND